VKIGLIVFVSVAFLYGCMCFQAATKDGSGQASASSGNSGSASPSNADSPLPVAPTSGTAIAPVSVQDRSSFSKLFSRGQQDVAPTLTYSCPDNGNSCGDACCTSSQQCCVNSSTGGHYCADKCS
jgi:hypothetical protein